MFPRDASILSSFPARGSLRLLQMQDAGFKVRHAAVAKRCHNAGGLEEGTPELDAPRATSSSTRTGGLLAGVPSDSAWAWGGAEGSARSLAADRPRQGTRSFSPERYGGPPRPRFFGAPPGGAPLPPLRRRTPAR